VLIKRPVLSDIDREAEYVPQVDNAEARLRRATSLPQTLAACFDAFEAIRVTARHCQDQVPGLFAAFMTAADAAVDGREALTVAPSLPHGIGRRPDIVTASDPICAADALVSVATVLRDRLSQAVATADELGDQAACHDAAEAADRIRQLMAR
jgi:hypothetical protein